MSGMAILWFCVMQPDASGWRRQIDQGVGNAVQAVNEISPNAASALGQGVEPFLDEAGQVLEAGVAEVQSAIEKQRRSAVNQVHELLNGAPAAGKAGSAATSGWPEFEHALAGSAGEQGRAAPSSQPTLRDRMRRPESTAAIPHLPPDSSRGTGVDRSHMSAAGAASSPDAGRLPTGLSVEGHSSAAEDQYIDDRLNRTTFEEDPSLRVSQAADRSGSLYDRLPDRVDADAGSRERGYGMSREAEAESSFGQIGRKRYLSPPPHQDDQVDPAASDEVRSANSMNRAGSRQGDGGLFDLPRPPGESSVTRNATAERAPLGSDSGEQLGERAVARPWGPLVLAVLALFGSLGLNFYLGWIAWDLYARHQDAVDDIHELEAKLETKQHEIAAAPGQHTTARQSLMR